MEKNWKNLFENGLYRSFEEKLNFFEYFNINTQDLENAFIYIKKGYENPIELKKAVEENIKKTIQLVQRYTKDESGKYSVPIKKEDYDFAKGYIAGVFFTAVRILTQEFNFILDNEESAENLIDPSLLRGEEKNAETYKKSLRVFLEGVTMWFSKMLNNSKEIEEILLNHDEYFDKGAFDLKGFRSLFVWIWIWSNLRYVTELHDYELNWNNENIAWPTLENLPLNLFKVTTIKEELPIEEELKKEIKVIDLWRDNGLINQYKNNQEAVISNFRHDKDIIQSDYFKVVLTLKAAHNLYTGFNNEGYVDMISEMLFTRYKVVLDGTKLSDVVDDFIYDVSRAELSSNTFDFYGCNIYEKPIMRFTGEEGKIIFIAYPEIIELTSKIHKSYNLPNAKKENEIDKLLEEDFNKFIASQIDVVDKKYKSHYFKYKNNYNLSFSTSKKGELGITFDQVFYDNGSNNLFFSKNVYFKKEHQVWSDIKNDLEMYNGSNSKIRLFLNGYVKEIFKNIKKIKKMFAADESTKISSIIFTNLETKHAIHYATNDFDFYVINYSLIDYFLKNVIFKKGTLTIGISDNLSASSDDKNTKKQKKN